MHNWQHIPPVAGECLLSVVIPTYNSSSRLSNCLQSVIGQMNERCELIVIDDGSTDSTETLLQEFSLAPGKRIGYLRQINKGPAAARNLGVSSSTGKWILPLDSDDELSPGALQAILKALVENPNIELLLGSYAVRDSLGRIRLKIPSVLAKTASARLEDYLLQGKTSMVHGATVFARALLLDCPYAEHLRQKEDMAVFANALASDHFLTITNPLVTINKHSGSLRHDADLAIRHGHEVAEEVFSRLPLKYVCYRRRFEAQCALSTFRSCYRVQLFEIADCLYRQAWRLSWRQAIRWTYLSKWLRMTLMGKTGNSAKRG